MPVLLNSAPVLRACSNIKEFHPVLILDGAGVFLNGALTQFKVLMFDQAVRNDRLKKDGRLDVMSAANKDCFKGNYLAKAAPCHPDVYVIGMKRPYFFVFKMCSNQVHFLTVRPESKLLRCLALPETSRTLSQGLL